MIVLGLGAAMIASATLAAVYLLLGIDAGRVTDQARLF